MLKRQKVGLNTKWLSNRNYLKEVSVEGKITNKFNFSIGFYDQYAAQIIRSGNCITLLSNNITINNNTFWNINYFEDFTKYVFWTFNNSFLLTLIDTIDTLSLTVARRWEELLHENFTPYDNNLEEQADEELQWCLVKNGHLKKDPKFNQMYLLDKENRIAILQALKEKIASIEAKEDKPKIIPDGNTVTEVKTTSFLDLLKPINGSFEETLDFMISKWAEAEFELHIFSKVDKLRNGKNPYGLNGAIGAMIDSFGSRIILKKAILWKKLLKLISLIAAMLLLN